MNSVTFEAFWSKSFLPVAKRMVASTALLTFDEAKKIEIFARYEALRNKVRKTSNFQNDAIKLDRHKVSAILLIACLESSLFSQTSAYKKIGKYFVFIELANEIFALSCALYLMQAFVEQIANNQDNLTLKRIAKEGFVFPKSFHGTYRMYLYRTIRVARKQTVSDVFYLANIFFLIERYTFCHKHAVSVD